MPSLCFKGRNTSRQYKHRLTFSDGSELAYSGVWDKHDVPVTYFTNYSGGNYSGSGDFYEHFTFTEFQANETIEELWAGFDVARFKHPSLCPAVAAPGGSGNAAPGRSTQKGGDHVQNSVAPRVAPRIAAAQASAARIPLPRAVNTTMYIFHPAAQFNIAGQDLGDAAGDVLFTCLDLMSSSNAAYDHGYAWISQWTVEILPVWGQYQNCNGYDPPQCLGANSWWVGREAAEGLAQNNAGQCTFSNEVGEWWSLPVDGHCPSNQTAPDGIACTWRAAERVKTINSACLFKLHNFRSLCESDKRSPFVNATRAFLRAFASEDTGGGGCPACNTTACPPG